MDATAQAELVRSGEASPVELVEGAIERAEAIDGELNAIIHRFYDEAREAAAGELPDGPFRGVPFLFKDIGASLAGQPLHLGTSVLKEADFRIPVDTYLGARFRDCGFVTIGKTNLPELGILGTTEPRAYGATHNPWALDRSPGGSSGGAAAAVAAGIVPIAHANDGAGSIRIPASFCGLVGLKPTRARTTAGPLVGDIVSGMSEELVVARSLRDIAAVLDAVHGPAPGDPYVASAPARPYVEELSAEPSGLRIGIRLDAFAGVKVDSVVIEATRDATGLLESLGHRVEEDAPRGFETPELRESFLDRIGAGTANTIGQLGALVGRELGGGDFEPLTWALAERGRRVSGSDYLRAIGLHQGITRVIAGWFESGFDLLVTPTVAEPPPPLGTFDDSGPDPMAAMDRSVPIGTFTALFNATGQPAISLPLHWSEEGLPIGVQLVAPYGREDVLIAVAAQLEEARPWADRRPPLFAAA